MPQLNFFQGMLNSCGTDEGHEQDFLEATPTEEQGTEPSVCYKK